MIRALFGTRTRVRPAPSPRIISRNRHPLADGRLLTPRIPWLRVFVEGVVIVGSILLAFGIDAWWEGRQEREEEREVLEGLRVEFMTVIEELELWAGYHRVKESLATQAIRLEPDELPDAVLDSLVSAIPIANVIDRGGGPLAALLASGRLELIRSRELRELLVRWPDRLEDMHTNELSMRNFIWGTMVPYMATRGVPDGRCEGIDLYAGELFCLHSEGPPASYRQLLEYPEFRSQLAFVQSLLPIIAVDQERARDLAREFVSLINVQLRG